MDVGVDRECRFVPDLREDYLCGFGADSREGFKFWLRLRDAACEFSHKDFAGVDYVAGFCAVKAAGFDYFCCFRLAEGDDFFGGVGEGEKLFCHHVYFFVRALG